MSKSQTANSAAKITPPLKSLKPVLVEWHDILDDGAEWQHGTSHPKPVKVKTIGYLVANEPKHVVLSRDYYDLDGHRTYGGRLAIPKGCIIRMVSLKADKP